MFQGEGLRITTEANIHSVDFLDVNFDLQTYTKPNQTPLYVHSSSNHPKKILENIPLAVNERLNRISSNQTVFNEAVPPFQEALARSGYTHTLVYSDPKCTPQSKRKNLRKRNVSWFNPPWNSAVKTNVGKQFLRIIDTSFPPNNPLRKLLSRRTVKISYKCMPKIQTEIIHDEHCQEEFS